MKIENILFDNDGTLYELQPDFIPSFVDVIIDYVSKVMGVGRKFVLRERQRLFEKYDVSSTGYVFSREYGSLFEEGKFIDDTYMQMQLGNYGIVEDKMLQDMLSRLDCRKSVLTNNPQKFAKKIISTIGVLEFMGNVIGSREMNYDLKPKIEAFERACEITDYDPAKTMFVDDVLGFHKNAKELGMVTVFVGDLESKCLPEFVDYNINRIYEVEGLFNEVNSK